MEWTSPYEINPLEGKRAIMEDNIKEYYHPPKEVNIKNKRRRRKIKLIKKN